MNDQNQNPLNTDGTFDINSPQTPENAATPPLNTGKEDLIMNEPINIPPTPTEEQIKEPREIPPDSLNANQPLTAAPNPITNEPELPEISTPEITPAEFTSSTAPEVTVKTENPVTTESIPPLESSNQGLPPVAPVPTTTPNTGKTKTYITIGFLVFLLAASAFAIYKFTASGESDSTATEDTPPGFTLNLGDDVEEETSTETAKQEDTTETPTIEEVQENTQEDTTPPSLEFNNEESTNTAESTTDTPEETTSTESPKISR